MKLASYKDGSRDGQLVVVSRDLSTAHFANGIATRLQQVLDDWNFLSPQLQDLYVTLNQGKARHAFAFEPRQCMAPLPRAYQWAVGSACLSHADRLRQAQGLSLPDNALSDPAMHQGAGDDFLGPCDDAWFGSAAWGIDLEAGLAVVTGDVAMGANPAQGLDGVRLLLLANRWCLRELLPAELAKGGGPLQAQPAAGFGPVAVTPDELGEAWTGGKLHLPLQVDCQERRLGLLDAGADMHFHFGQLVAHLAKTRNLRAGCIVGSGAISQTNASRGVACLAEQRALETLDAGAPRTGWLALGDRVRIQVTGRDGQSVFGAIEQRVVGPGFDLTDGADGAASAAGTAP